MTLNSIMTNDIPTPHNDAEAHFVAETKAMFAELAESLKPTAQEFHNTACAVADIAPTVNVRDELSHRIALV